MLMLPNYSFLKIMKIATCMNTRVFVYTWVHVFIKYIYNIFKNVSLHISMTAVCYQNRKKENSNKVNVVAEWISCSWEIQNPYGNIFFASNPASFYCLGSSGWWVKYLSFCHAYERSRGSFWCLTSTLPSHNCCCNLSESADEKSLSPLWQECVCMCLSDET